MASYFIAALAPAMTSALLGMRSLTRVRGLAAADPSASAVLVTGCSSGIGLDTAQALAARGVTVFATVRKDADAEMLRAKAGGNVVPLLCDVAVQADIAALLDKVQAELEARPALRLTGVVNNAGVLKKDPDELSSAVLEQIVAVNLLGVYRLTETFLPLLHKAGSAQHGAARVVNIGSYFGSFLAGAEVPSYSATKYALEPLSDGLRRRLSHKGIHVALVKPGNIDTDMNQKYAEGPASDVTDAILDALFSAAPMTRYYPGKFGGLPTRLACWLFPALPDRLADALWKRSMG